MTERREYADAGVDYKKISGFKDAMVEVAKRTKSFPNRRQVYVVDDLAHAHGGVWRYTGSQPHMWAGTLEGLGNKNWIAEWMYKFSGMDSTFYQGIGIDVALMAVNDVIAQGARPTTYKDEIAAGDSDWFADTRRAADLANSFYEVCRMVGMALVGGESPALRYLVKAEPPVESAPVLSGEVTGIIAPASNLITGQKVAAGDRILGVTSSGIHANGISLVIKKAMALPNQFLTKLDTGRTLGEEALIPTRSYVALVEALLDAEVDVHAFLPGTGGGVGKLAVDKRPFTYRVHTWPFEIPPLFMFMLELGVPLMDCLTTFNWGVGYYVFVPPHEVDRAIDVGTKAGYDIREIGIVEDGQRRTIFEPEGWLVLPPPEE